MLLKPYPSFISVLFLTRVPFYINPTQEGASLHHRFPGTVCDLLCGDGRADGQPEPQSLGPAYFRIVRVSGTLQVFCCTYTNNLDHLLDKSLFFKTGHEEGLENIQIVIKKMD